MLCTHRIDPANRLRLSPTARAIATASYKLEMRRLLAERRVAIATIFLWPSILLYQSELKINEIKQA
jgi:hypothetical protein